MKFVRSTLGYMIAGLVVMSVWGIVLDGQFGTLGGILAGFLLIGLLWFMNHFVGLIHHGPESGFIDQGLGIAFTGIFRDLFTEMFKTGATTPLTDSLPTIALVVLGAILGGTVAGLVEADMAKDKGGK